MQLFEKFKQAAAIKKQTQKPKYYNTRLRTPTLLQMEAVECGAAALGIILSYYGRIVPLPELRVSCGVSRDGSKASNMILAAQSYGMQAQGFKKDIQQLQEIKPPFIVFWNFNHFVVVEGFVGKTGGGKLRQRVWLNDPATGPRSVTMQEFDAAYTGVVLVMEPGAEFHKGGKKADIIGALYSRLKNSFGELLFCVLIGFLLVIPNLALAAISQVFIDNVLIKNRLDWLQPMLIGMGAIALLQAVMNLLQLRKLRYLNLRLSISMTGQFIWHLLCLPSSFYAQRYAGEISNRIGINKKVASILSGKLARTAIDAVMIVFYAAMMLAYDRLLTLIGVAAVVINVTAIQLRSRRRIDTSMRLSQDQGKLAGVEIGTLQSIETIKAGAIESDIFSRWAGYYAKLTSAEQEMYQDEQWVSLLPLFLSSVTTMLLLVIGGLRVIDGHLTIGMLVAFQSLMSKFQSPVNTLLSLGTTIQTLNGDMKRLDDVLQNPTDSSLQPIATIEQLPVQYAWPVDKCCLQGYVELRNLTFGYSRVEAPLIENFSCTLTPGQRVAFVGSSGSGKSTISKLITGLYQPWDGEILFDGVPRQQIPRAVITNSLAMVEQEIFLFGGTVRENLTLWDETISDVQLMKACQDAAILDVVMAIPDGLDGKLLESASNLSGGQRQRLEIARALVNNPSILVMDEATSALDANTEKIIDKNIRRRGCTCMIVAHRLSTIRDCDEIIVLERGKVVQRGTHEEMKSVDGAYRRLIQAE
ncbi:MULTISPECIES: NHLP family bacteriocin export ABC transporter peptidase/permease/ATPase subunit [unclassified Tolypothrix]|uniref:NHLP family bacteriocin export ABC transporter peptidase/permease/ATPase subunit n=1 Tax=unclassified Tolypothrix TaxID=2649714 RepID=UPI0005EABB6D|nr:MULTISPECIES: NHLP family bacteriocin export ABC transporter peptidase/permease/ATPase subunit [unclassified Tolypothrix]UYD30645.1 NHLP family bacteriocin export ABC transporter peptidase/permease/ATPase subunit [Tolypothrix sp. PCC 7712]BAY95566.1 ABC transporter, transmembrane region [Microchaete diplosiphon NIES-3275]EKE98330.1 ABC transporter, ATP-binding protein [Tolypothrix sp. PCC 7601]MBE9084691.1 NHLP family bacteriocin export ABC transporter peptidase/permease/ATPase subunit [Toly